MTSAPTFGKRGGARVSSAPYPPRQPSPQPPPTTQQPSSPRSDNPHSGLGWLLFSYQGRCRRSHYWLAHIGLMVGYFTALAAIGAMRPKPVAAGAADVTSLLLDIVLLLIELAIVVGFFWALLAVDVKRCHDRNKSGWFVLISFIPLLNLWTFVELGCLDGARGENRYGPSPKGPDPAVFS
jgi:uncharacterized membrane protein YhaH (DUF805 family)